jgi:hypothetical protein
MAVNQQGMDAYAHEYENLVLNLKAKFDIYNKVELYWNTRTTPNLHTRQRY